MVSVLSLSGQYQKWPHSLCLLGTLFISFLKIKLISHHPSYDNLYLFYFFLTLLLLCCKTSNMHNNVWQCSGVPFSCDEPFAGIQHCPWLAWIKGRVLYTFCILRDHSCKHWLWDIKILHQIMSRSCWKTLCKSHATILGMSFSFARCYRCIYHESFYLRAHDDDYNSLHTELMSSPFIV